MNLIKAIILGMVQGLTEFLPVSSSGHLVIFQRIFGIETTGVTFEVADRAHGVSKFSYRKLTRFALDGLMSFSTLPLKVWIYVGTAVSFIALVMAFYFILQTISEA